MIEKIPRKFLYIDRFSRGTSMVCREAAFSKELIGKPCKNLKISQNYCIIRVRGFKNEDDCID